MKHWYQNAMFLTRDGVLNIHLQKSKVKLFIFFFYEEIIKLNFLLVSIEKLIAHPCVIAIIPCQLHPGQMDSIQHCLENVIELWIWRFSARDSAQNSHLNVKQREKKA